MSMYTCSIEMMESTIHRNIVFITMLHKQFGSRLGSTDYTLKQMIQLEMLKLHRF